MRPGRGHTAKVFVGYDVQGASPFAAPPVALCCAAEWTCTHADRMRPCLPSMTTPFVPAGQVRADPPRTTSGQCNVGHDPSSSSGSSSNSSSKHGRVTAGFTVRFTAKVRQTGARRTAVFVMCIVILHARAGGCRTALSAAIPSRAGRACRTVGVNTVAPECLFGETYCAICCQHVQPCSLSP